MAPTSTFQASCILMMMYIASMVCGNVIPSASSTSGSMDLVARLRDTVGTLSFPDEGLASAVGSGSGVHVEGMPGNKRSAPAGDNLSDMPSAFAVAHDMSGDELAQMLLAGSSDAMSPTPSSLRCAGDSTSTADSTVTSYSEFASEVCQDAQMPAFDSNEPRTRGLCPWEYVDNVDINRYPSTMKYAQCVCKDCRRQDGTGYTNEQACQPIYYNTKVLRKHTCQDGIQIYVSDYELVPVACACLNDRV